VSSLKSFFIARLPHTLAGRLRHLKRSLQSNWIDEAEIVARLAPDDEANESVLVDVGAHHGSVTALFLEKGWSVVAYEPDPSNRAEFTELIGPNERVQLSAAAVSDSASESAALFTSSVSTGISALSSFDKSHVPTALVEVVTLTEDLHARSIRQVDFLKVDIEGFDLFALKGFDWAYAPRFVLYEFEDRKTTPLGYSLAESSAYMAGQGYRLVYSVWEPIVRYGSRHEWRGLFLTPPTDVAHCWGNVLCFRDETDFDGCMGKHLRKPWALVGRRGRN
jgi:FkbM family methyltransferase